MSHFVTIRTILSEREALLEALRALGFDFEEGPSLVVRGDPSRSEIAEIVVKTGSDFDVGFRLKEDAYEIVADWYRVEQHTALRRADFTQAITRQYSLEVVRSQAREQNLIIEDEEELPNGDIVVTLSERG